MTLSQKFHQSGLYRVPPLVVGKSPREISVLARRARDDKNINLSFDLLRGGIALHPNDPYLWRDMGFTLVDAREYRESLEFFKKAHDLAPNNLTIGKAYAKRLVIEKQTEMAERIFMGYLPTADNVDCIRIFEELGNLYDREKEHGLAAACLGKAIEKGTTFEWALNKYEELRNAGFSLNATTWPVFLNRLESILTPDRRPKGEAPPAQVLG